MIRSDDDSLKELRAYNIGYDLGWYRAHEGIANELQEIADAILQSATFKEIERENGDRPIFLAKILNIISDIATMRNEKLPVLLLEREKINEIGALIAKLPDEAIKTFEINTGMKWSDEGMSDSHRVQGFTPELQKESESWPEV